MNRFITIALLITATLLTGCVGQGRSALELNPYTAEEVQQKALEDLSRQGLSFDEYNVRRAALMGAPVRDFDFDGQDELNADRGFTSKNRQG